MAIQSATPETFDELTKEGFVIADFFSSTCVPCKMLSQVLEDIEAELPFVNIDSKKKSKLISIERKICYDKL
jgi:thioredoxin 1